MMHLPAGVPPPVFGSRQGPETGAGAFSIGSIRHRDAVKPFVDGYFQRVEKEHVSVYPTGVEFHTCKAPKTGPEVETVRGKIKGMSDKARRRLLEFYVTHEVPGTRELSVTLTTRQKLSRGAFARAKDRFGKRLVRAGGAAIWVPELQRRGAPHAHLFLFAPPTLSDEQLREMWLECSGQERDPDARIYAYHTRPVPDKDAGWAIYMAKHIGKESLQKEGWQGKSWGVFGRSKFVKREAKEFTLNKPQAAKVRRWLLRHQNSIRRRDLRKAWERKQEAIDRFILSGEYETFDRVKLRDGTVLLIDLNGNVAGTESGPRSVLPEVQEYERLRKLLRPLRKLHGGDLFRLVPGEVMERICTHALR